MTSYKTPGRNCPACCPQKCGSSRQELNIANGLQVPIHLEGEKGLPISQGPRRFTGRDWRDRIPELTLTKAKNFKQKSNKIEYPTQSWSGGPDHSTKEDMALEFRSKSVSDIAHSGITLAKKKYASSCAEVAAAVKYLRHLWLTTSGSYSEKGLAVNRMLCFYLILLGIYVAERSFWVNQQLFEGLCDIILRPKRNSDMLMGLGAVAVFIFILYLFGAPVESEGVCIPSGN